MKHRILLEFSADTLPDDFLDQIAGRVYGHPAVDKKECTASFVGDVLKDAERYQWLKERYTAINFDWEESGQQAVIFTADNFPIASASCDKTIDAAIDAAKDTQ